MQRTSPHKILPGGHIGIAAPASFFDAKHLYEGMQNLAEWGYAVSCDERILLKDRFHAGPDQTRAEIFNVLCRDKEIRAIWCARGGYGATRILPLLDKMGSARALGKNPKLIIGYSDITALQLWAYKKLGLKSVHAPLIATPKWLKLPHRTKTILQSILTGSLVLGEKSYTRAWPTRWLKIAPKKNIEGIILGGNLTLITNLVGTPWLPSFNGSLLFLEDCAEAPYRIDRMLTQLRNAGALKGVRAVLAGDFTADAPKAPPSKNWKRILELNFAEQGIPVLWNLPVGHGKRNEPLPLGVKARLTKSGKLELLEQAVR